MLYHITTHQQTIFILTASSLNNTPTKQISTILQHYNSTAIMAPYCTDGRQTSDGMAGLVGFRQLGLSFLLEHLADACSGCIQDAPIIQNDDANLPLLIYSHGYGGNMDMATYFMRTMASKGDGRSSNRTYRWHCIFHSFGRWI